jgi:hypothetical protein
LEGLADHAAVTGNPPQAIDYLEQAITISDDISPRRSALLRARIAELSA